MLTEGYAEIANGRPQVFSPGAVLVVGDQEGFDLDGKKYRYGTIIVAEGSPDKPRYRVARPEDRIILTGKVKVFGREYGPGAFIVPPGGNPASVSKP